VSEQFEREHRYLVVKYKDILKYLCEPNQRQLLELVKVIDFGRELDNRGPLECVCVEQDWPEFEPTWKAIEARMTGSASPAANADSEPVAYMHKATGVLRRASTPKGADFEPADWTSLYASPAANAEERKDAERICGWIEAINNASITLSVLATQNRGAKAAFEQLEPVRLSMLDAISSAMSQDAKGEGNG
jgi:hypothetical protein